MSDERAPTDRLNDVLDELVTGHPWPVVRLASDSGAAEAARRFHALEDVPAPSRHTIGRIWENVMTNHPPSHVIEMPPATTERSSSTDRTPTIVWPRSHAGRGSFRRWMPGSDFATAALILLTLTVGYTAYQQANPPTEDGGSNPSAGVGASPLAGSDLGWLSCGPVFIGESSATTDGIEVRVLLVDPVPPVPGTSPSAGTSHVAFEVAITNTSTEPLRYRPQDFQVVDCRGDTAIGLGGGVEPAIGAGVLPPGATIRGWLTFTPPAANVQLQQIVYRLQGKAGAGAIVRCSLVNTGATQLGIIATPGHGNGCRVDAAGEHE